MSQRVVRGARPQNNDDVLQKLDEVYKNLKKEIKKITQADEEEEIEECDLEEYILLDECERQKECIRNQLTEDYELKLKEMKQFYEDKLKSCKEEMKAMEVSIKEMKKLKPRKTTVSALKKLSK